MCQRPNSTSPVLPSGACEPWEAILWRYRLLIETFRGKMSGGLVVLDCVCDDRGEDNVSAQIAREIT